MTETRCSERLHDGFHSHQCSKRATVEVQGKWYCTIHDPIRRKRKADERSAKWQAEREQSRRRFGRQRLALDLASLAIKEPDTFPPNAQPIIEQLLTLATPRPAHEEG